MSIVVMKRKAAARARPLSKGGFSITGKSTTTNSSTRTVRQMASCNEVVEKRNDLDILSHGEYLQDKTAECLQNQDTTDVTSTSTLNNCNIVEPKNGQYGSSYESYDAYIRRMRYACD